jgi:hypothetical protein
MFKIQASNRLSFTKSMHGRVVWINVFIQLSWAWYALSLLQTLHQEAGFKATLKIVMTKENMADFPNSLHFSPLI